MNIRVLAVIAIFLASVYVGRGLINTETVQAQPVTPSYLEMLSLTQPKVEETKSESVDTIDIVYNKETQEVSIKGTSDAYVNVTTTGKQKPVVKWKTKIVKEKGGGYPYVKSIGQIPDSTKAISPF